MIVDDTEAAGYILGKLLETLGQQVETATSGVAALQRIEQECPDLVISDVGMPDMDGYELARRVRQNPALCGVVLVALTGYAQDSDRQQALAAGFNHYLMKPVSMEALEKILTSLPVPSPTGRR